MKRRKQIGAPHARPPKGGDISARQSDTDGMLAALMEQNARSEIKKKLLGLQQRRRNGKAPSKQPPLSDEMKTVTEIGSGKWKSGQTK